jgi:hypothetical protein
MNRLVLYTIFFINCIFTCSIQAQTSIQATVKNATCNGLPDGEIQLFLTGKAPFVIKWEDGSGFIHRKALQPGKYEVIVTDANKQVSKSSFTVHSGNILTVTPTISNRSISVIAEGGIAPYTFYLTNITNPRQVISQNSASSIFNNLPAGSYALLVKDSKGCTAIQTVELK